MRQVPSLWTVRVSAGLVALGVALRLLQYAIPRSLWFDEARNAAEILKDHWRLMLPPHSAQPTAFGFLYLERAFVALLGEGELALRLFPLLAGITALFVAARLAHRSLRGWAGPFAVAMLALCGPAIYFSTEVKSYSSDLLLGLLIALAFSNLAKRPAARAGSDAVGIVLFGLLGAVGLWISYTSLFFLAIAGSLLMLQALRARDWSRSGLYAGMGVSWLASFALHYQLAIAHWSGTRWLNAFWSAGFPRTEEGFLATLSWSALSLIAAFEEPLGARLWGSVAPGGALFLFATGVLVTLLSPQRTRAPDGGDETGRSVLSLFAGVFALSFACALVHVYPFKGRLLVFLVPPMAFLVAHGAWWWLAMARERGERLHAAALPALAVVLAAGLLAGNARSALRLVSLEPLHRHGTVNLARLPGGAKGFEGASEVVSYVARNYERGDTIYLYYSAEPDYAYYARRLGFRAPTITGVRSQGDFRAYAADLDELRGNSRVWLVFCNTVEAERSFFLRHLESIGKRLDYYRRPRADAYLFDLRSVD